MNKWFKKFMLIQMRSFTNYVTGKCSPFALITCWMCKSFYTVIYESTYLANFLLHLGRDCEAIIKVEIFIENAFQRLRLSN